MTNNQSDDYVMYLLVNNDLKMEKGKIASQVGHCVQHIIESILISYYENKKTKHYNDYLKWKNGCKKIVLKATQTQLEYLKNDSNAISIYDAGKTQIEPNSLTIIGFFPSSSNSKKFEQYKLL